MVGHKVHLQPCQRGPVREEHLDHIKYVLPADRYISAVPDYEWFGHKINLRLNSKNIPDFQWDLTNEQHTLNIGAVPYNITRENWGDWWDSWSKYYVY